MHMTRIACCAGGLAGWALLACASPAVAQQATAAVSEPAAGQPARLASSGAVPLVLRRFRFGAKPVSGIPVGDFGDRVGTSPGVGFDFTSRVGQIPIAVGAEFGYVMYGKETRHVQLTPAVPEVLTDVNTTNNLLQTHALVRVQPRAGRVRPYVEGLLGFRYVFTHTSFGNPDEGNSGSTQLSDFAPSVGGGGGVTIGLVSGREFGLHLDIGLRYLTGGDVEYLTKGAITRDETGVTLDPTRSAINLVSLQFGVAIDF